MRPDVLLIHPPYHRRAGSGVTFPLGLGYVAEAARKAGFSVDLVDCAARFDALSKASLAELRAWLSLRLRECEPRLAIGVGPCTTSAVRGLKTIAETCKIVLPSTPVIYGGPLASSTGQEWFFFEELGGTAIVVGDGEWPFVQWLLALSENEYEKVIPGVAYPTSTGVDAYVERDLDGLPFPARDLDPVDTYRLSVRRDLGATPFATLVGSRGCLFRCKFCVSGELRGGTYTRRSFENIGAEVAQLVNNFSTRCVVFYDDALFPSRGMANHDLLRLSGTMAEISSQLVWQFETRPDIACGFDNETLQYAYASGCRQINLGIEKSTVVALRRIGKNFHTEQSREACERIAREVPLMRLAGTFILGGPGETTESVKDTIAFARSLPLTFAHFNPLELYPGTELYREVFGMDNRKWYDLVMEDDSDWGEIIFENGALSKERLLSLVNKAYGDFYDDPGWRMRAEYILGSQMHSVMSWAQLWRNDRLRLLK